MGGDNIGKIIAISGIDGSGKTTCARIIKEYFEQIGQKAVIIDSMKCGMFVDKMQEICSNKNESIRDFFSSNIINIAWTMDLIYIYEKVVQDYINHGYNVILHRSELCCRVYSHLFGSNGHIIDNILDEYDINYDLHLFLDIHPSLAYHRIVQRNCKMVTKKEEEKNLFAAATIYKNYLNYMRYKNIHIFSVESDLNTMQNGIVEIMKKEAFNGDS